MDMLLDFFRTMQSYNILAEYMGFIFFSTLLITLVCNLHDTQRIWIVCVFFSFSLIDLFVYRILLPHDLLIRQSVYITTDLLIIYLLQNRVIVCHQIYAVLEPKNNNKFFVRMLKDMDYTKQEYAIRSVLLTGVLVNMLLIIEHCIRHPEFFGFAENTNLQQIQWIFNAYPTVKTVLTFLVILGLISMTIDGIAQRRIKDAF
jgi:hypothetical protein